MLHHLTTSNGIALVVEPLPHTHSVSLGCFLAVGALHEPADAAGVAHMIEHMVFKGTAHFPTARELSQAIEGVGGALNASTAYESTVFWGKVADLHVERLVQVIGDLVCRPRLDPADFERERKVIIEELRGLQDDPDEWAQEMLHSSLWGTQPLGRDIAGSIETVSAIDLAMLRQFWQDYYHTGSTIISIAGNISPERAKDLVEAAFADLPRGPQRAAPPILPPVPGPQLTFRARDTEQAYLSLAMPGLSYRDPDRRAFHVLDTILGGNMSSRLFQVLREDHGLAYDVGSFHNEFADAGMWVVYAGVEPANLRDTLVMKLAIIAEVAEHGITDEELDMVKEQVKGSILISLEDSWSVASRNGSHMLRYGHIIPVEQVVAEVEAISAEDLRRVAQRVLRREHLHVAVIGPFDEEDRDELAALVAAALP